MVISACSVLKVGLGGRRSRGAAAAFDQPWQRGVEPEQDRPRLFAPGGEPLFRRPR